jgi:hypothetical protein
LLDQTIAAAAITIIVRVFSLITALSGTSPGRPEARLYVIGLRP